MIANNQEGEILGVVFLYKIFETIAEYNNQVATALNLKNQPHEKTEHREVEMAEISKPLLKH